MPKSSGEKKSDKPFWKGVHRAPKDTLSSKGNMFLPMNLEFVHPINSLMQTLTKCQLGNIIGMDVTMRNIILLLLDRNV